MKLSVIIITCILSFNYGECRPKTGPTIIALPFNAVDDANAIISAMEKSSSDNKDKIVDILMSKTIAQRLEIGAEYEKIKNMDFKKEIEKYFNGKLDSDKNMLEILKTTTEFLASRLHHSLTKCDNEDYMSIMITSSTEMLRNVCATYQKEYNQEVSSDVNAHLSYDNELSGFINKLISYDIDEQRSDHAKVDDELTKKLVSAMPTKTMNFATDPFKTFAEQINEDIKGKNDFEDSACPRILISRSEIDMADIRTAYDAAYENGLEWALRKYYHKREQMILTALANGNQP
ncbi:annexin A1 isoform X1 [Nilaparvata lugens]|uniref:annexin A1 isoform X1 n=1 Tax=Nilaparvata lugens TaxID=108931 RepID=UPI00193D2BB8|nr:annexin A1 isoform X1 [Nilaparvata lugens]